MTSGRYKRAMKRAVNPFYGRKGVGFLKNPSKSIRGMAYRRLTVGTAPSDINRALRKSAGRKKVANNKIPVASLKVSVIDDSEARKSANSLDKDLVDKDEAVGTENTKQSHDDGEKAERRWGKRQIILAAIAGFFLLALISPSSSKNTSNNTSNSQVSNTSSTDAGKETTEQNNTESSTNVEVTSQTNENTEKSAEPAQPETAGYVGQYKETATHRYSGSSVWTFNADGTAEYTRNKNVPYKITQDSDFKFTAKSYYMIWLLEFSSDWSKLKAINDYNGSVVEFQRI